VKTLRPLLCSLLLALAAGSAFAPVLAQELRPKEVSGAAVVLDGDTIRVGLAVVRLWGVDAPEITSCRAATVPMQPFCGGPKADQSLESLARIIGNREIVCREVNRDSFRQMMGQCFIGRTNVGVEQIRSGFAVGWPSYLRQNAELALPYTAAEAEARSARRGFWQ
jgi:endonuclease YncB( thermonuclease family)